MLYDLIFDVPGNHPFSACRRALKPEGRYVLIGHERFGQAGQPVLGILPYFLTLVILSPFVKQLRGPAVPLPSKHDAMASLKELLAAGKITPIIDSTYRLSQVHAAFRRMMAAEIHGKVILTPAEAD